MLPNLPSAMSQSSGYTTIIFDLEDILFQWSPGTKTNISSETLHKILNTHTWFDYERGRISEDSCYAYIGEEFSIKPEEVRHAFRQVRDSRQANNELILLIRELKVQSSGRLRVFAMSNISSPDYDALRTKPVDWVTFDRVFTSGAAGERKPNLGFYKYVLRATGVDPRNTIFVDSKLENVLSARSLGLHGIIFESPGSIKRALRNLLENPVARGRDFLKRNAGRLLSVTDGADDHHPVVLQENFAQLLILEATGDHSLVNLIDHPRTWNFFQGKGQLTTEQFPFDLDTTSLGLTIMQRDKIIASSVMDEMLEYVDDDGIIQTYFDHKRPRFDPVVCVNALSLFYTYGRGRELQETLQWVHEVLLNRAYLDGTRYYDTAECFLFFVSRLLTSSNDPELHSTLEPLLKERVQERIGAEGDSLALAMRLLVCDAVGFKNLVDFRNLLPLQMEDGGWEIGWMYKYGSSGIRIGNRGLTTALAIKAIDATITGSTGSTEHLVTAPAFATKVPLKVTPAATTRHRRRSSLIDSLQWLWPGGKFHKSAEI
ncbi:HAD-like domain-containing protein [Collybia nuda]|uniref:HAD-like domain-containing protein n=1 Tax=Collybia nuda TaxID=64659 RepID=A0A9P5YAB4_9AGAR|nr:HAD-like domain-containing protein [Collybia nuda]